MFVWAPVGVLFIPEAGVTSCYFKLINKQVHVVKTVFLFWFKKLDNIFIIINKLQYACQKQSLYGTYALNKYKQ